MISLVSFPLMAGLLVVSDSFVLALYGPKWEAVIPVLRVLCVAGLVQSVISPGGWIYLSQGRTDIHFRWGVVAGVVILGGVVAGILLGTVRSVACCYTIAFCSLIYPMVMIPGRLIGMKFSAFLKAVGGPFVSAAAMAVVVAAATHLAPDGLPAIALLCSQALVGVLVYGLLVRFLDQTACREATDLAISLWRKTRSRRLGRDCQSG
jgi:O-antigen/teichoic acid export membrane protein